MDTENTKIKEISPRELFLDIKSRYLERDNKVFETLCDFLMLFFAMMLSRTHLLFGVCPLAIALMAASSRRTVFIYIGSLIGAMTLASGSMGYIIIYSSLLLARVLVSLPLRIRWFLPRSRFFFCEAPQLRISLACLCGLGAGIYELIISSFAYYAILFAVGSTLLAPVMTFLFVGIYESDFSLTDAILKPRYLAFERLNLYSALTWISYISLCVALVYSLSDYALFGIRAAFLFLSAISIVTSRKCSPIVALIIGVLSAALLEPIYIPAFAIIGLISGIYAKENEIYSLLFSVFSAIIYASLVRGLAGFLAIMPTTVIPALLVWPLFRERAAASGSEDRCEAEELGTGGESYMRLDRLSEVFSELSGVFHTASDTMGRPAISEYFHTCDAVCNNWCKSCASRAECWESGERYAYRAMQSISERLYRRGVTDTRCIPKSLSDKCPHIDEIVGEIQRRCATLTKERHKKDSSELIAFDYEMIAKLLRESAKNDMLDTSTDRALSDRLTKCLADEFKLRDARVGVIGKRNKRISITARVPNAVFEAEGEIQKRFSELCGCDIGRMRLERDRIALDTLPKYKVSAECAVASAREGEDCGDKLSTFQNSDGLFYSLLCDGMGSGELAAKTASFASSFLTKMLSSGMSKTTSIKMLNNFLRYKGSECSSTVDMFELDTLSGKASFVKSGATPSFIKRGENIFRIRSKTVPIGLLRSVDAEKIDFTAQAGDTVIMFSDGISQSPDEDEWFLSLLADISPTDSPLTVAQTLLSEARRHTKKPDDMSVCVLRIMSTAKFSDIKAKA